MDHNILITCLKICVAVSVVLVWFISAFSLLSLEITSPLPVSSGLCFVYYIHMLPLGRIMYGLLFRCHAIVSANNARYH